MTRAPDCSQSLKLIQDKCQIDSSQPNNNNQYRQENMLRQKQHVPVNNNSIVTSKFNNRVRPATFVNNQTNMSQGHELYPLGEAHGYDVLHGMTITQQVQLVQYIRQYHKPNVYGARVPLKTNWNISLMQALASSTSDREVVQFATYGWPLNYQGGLTN